MKMERSIYLIRHGHVGRDGDPKRYTGVTDVPLSDIGRRQALSLAGWLADKPVGCVYCSDLSRSIETAEIIAPKLGKKPAIVPDLHEINMGAWEGKTFEEIRARSPEAYAQRGRDIADFRPPGGESFSECEKRAWYAFAGILEETSGGVAIVAHAGVNRVLLRRILGMDAHKIFCLRQDYGCVNNIGCGKDTFTIRLLNFVPGRGC